MRKGVVHFEKKKKKKKNLGLPRSHKGCQALQAANGLKEGVVFVYDLVVWKRQLACPP